MLGNEVLPQPYRFINKLVQRCVDLALEDIVKNLTRGAVIDKKYLPSTMTPVFDLKTDAFSPDNDDRLQTITNVTTVHGNHLLVLPSSSANGGGDGNLLQSSSSATGGNGAFSGSFSPNARPPSAPNASAPAGRGGSMNNSMLLGGAGGNASSSSTGGGVNNAAVFAALSANMRGKSPIADLLAAQHSAQIAKEKKEALQLPLPQAQKLTATHVGPQFTVVGTQAGTCAIYNTTTNEHWMTTPILLSAELSNSFGGGSGAAAAGASSGPSYSSVGVVPKSMLAANNGGGAGAGNGGGGLTRSLSRAAIPKANGGGAPTGGGANSGHNPNASPSSPLGASTMGSLPSSPATGKRTTGGGALGALAGGRNNQNNNNPPAVTYPEGVVAVHGGTPLHPQGLNLFAAASAVDGVVVFAADADRLSVQPTIPPPRPLPPPPPVVVVSGNSPSTPSQNGLSTSKNGSPNAGRAGAGRRASNGAALAAAAAAAAAAARAATPPANAMVTPTQQGLLTPPPAAAFMGASGSSTAAAGASVLRSQSPLLLGLGGAAGGLNYAPKEPTNLHIVTRISGAVIATLAQQHLRSVGIAALPSNSSSSGPADAALSSAAAASPMSPLLASGGTSKNGANPAKSANKDSAAAALLLGHNTALSTSGADPHNSSADGGDSSEPSSAADPHKYGSTAALRRLAEAHIAISPTATVPSSIKVSPDGTFLCVGVDNDGTLLIFDLTEEPSDFYLADTVVRIPKFIAAVSCPMGLAGPVVDGSMLRAKGLYEFLCDSKGYHIRAGVSVADTAAVIALGGGAGGGGGGGGSSGGSESASAAGGPASYSSRAGTAVGGGRPMASSSLGHYSSAASAAAHLGNGNGNGNSALAAPVPVNTRAPIPSYVNSLVVGWAGCNSFTRVNLRDDGIANCPSAATAHTASGSVAAANGGVGGSVGAAERTTTSSVLITTMNMNAMLQQQQQQLSGGVVSSVGSSDPIADAAAAAAAANAANAAAASAASSTFASFSSSNVRSTAASWAEAMQEAHGPLFNAYSVAANSAGAVAAAANNALMNAGGGAKGGGGGGGGKSGGKESASTKEAAAAAAAASAQFLGATTHPAMGATQFGCNGYSSHIAHHVAALAGIGLASHVSGVRNGAVGGIGVGLPPSTGGAGGVGGAAALPTTGGSFSHQPGGGGSSSSPSAGGGGGGLNGTSSSSSLHQLANSTDANNNGASTSGGSGGGGTASSAAALGQHQQHIFAPLPPSCKKDQLLAQIVTTTAVDPSHRLFAVCCQNALTMVYDGDLNKFRFYFNDAPHRMQQRAMRQMSCIQAVFQNRDTLTVATVAHGKAYRSFVSVFALNPEVAVRLRPDVIAAQRRADYEGQSAHIHQQHSMMNGSFGGGGGGTVRSGATSRTSNYHHTTATNNPSGLNDSPPQSPPSRGITGLSNTVVSRLDMTSRTRTDAAVLARMPGPLEEMLAAFDDQRRKNASDNANKSRVRGVHGQHATMSEEKRAQLMRSREAMQSSCSVATTNASSYYAMPGDHYSHTLGGGTGGGSGLLSFTNNNTTVGGLHHSSLSMTAHAGGLATKADANFAETYEGELICKVPYLDQLVFASPIGDFPILLIRASGGRQFVIDMTCGELLGILKDTGRHVFTGFNTKAAMYNAAANKYYCNATATAATAAAAMTGGVGGASSPTSAAGNNQSPYATLSALLSASATPSSSGAAGGAGGHNHNAASAVGGASGFRGGSASMRGGGGGAPSSAAAGAGATKAGRVSSANGGGGRNESISGRSGHNTGRTNSVMASARGPSSSKGLLSGSHNNGGTANNSSAMLSASALNANGGGGGGSVDAANTMNNHRGNSAGTAAAAAAAAASLSGPTGGGSIAVANGTISSMAATLYPPANTDAATATAFRQMVEGPFTLSTPKPSTVAFSVKMADAVPRVVLSDDTLIVSCDGGRSIQRYPMLPLFWRFYPKLKDHFSLQVPTAQNEFGGADGDFDPIRTGTGGGTAHHGRRANSPSSLVPSFTLIGNPALQIPNPQTIAAAATTPSIGVTGSGKQQAFKSILSSGGGGGGGGGKGATATTTVVTPTSTSTVSNGGGIVGGKNATPPTPFGIAASTPEALGLALFYFPHSSRIDLIDRFVAADVDRHVASRLGLTPAVMATAVNFHSATGAATAVGMGSTFNGSAGDALSMSGRNNNSPPRILTPTLTLGGAMKRGGGRAHHHAILSRATASTPPPMLSASTYSGGGGGAATMVGGGGGAFMHPASSHSAAATVGQPLPILTTKFADLTQQGVEARKASKALRDARVANTWRALQSITSTPPTAAMNPSASSPTHGRRK